MKKSKAVSPESFQIEPARPGDEADICALIHGLAKYEKAPESCIATPEMVREQLFGSRPVAHALLVRVDGRAVAFALYFLNFSTWLCRPGLYLEDLFVMPEHRKRGIGSALLRHLARLCVEKGYGRFEWSCLDWNELAKAQYRKIGAAPLDEWRIWRLTGDALKEFAATDAPAEDQPAGETKEKQAKAPVTIYTDGGCRPNPGTGGWAAILIAGDKVRELSGGEPDTTNNRMEMLAAINALETLKRPCHVTFYTDSQYVKNGITKWIAGWKKKGWKTSTKSDVKNADLWQRLDAAIQRHRIDWRWTRGHSGDHYNERCDELAGREIDRVDSESRRR